jgi:hypothetical protein
VRLSCFDPIATSSFIRSSMFLTPNIAELPAASADSPVCALMGIKVLRSKIRHPWFGLTIGIPRWRAAPFALRIAVALHEGINDSGRAVPAINTDPGLGSSHRGDRL